MPVVSSCLLPGCEGSYLLHSSPSGGTWYLEDGEFIASFGFFHLCQNLRKDQGKLFQGGVDYAWMGGKGRKREELQTEW